MLFVTTLSGTAASAAIGGATPAGAASVPSCNLKSLASHQGLVNITFWESASEANLTVLQGITSAFNSSQTKVHVTLVTQAGYDDTWTKYLAGLSNGQLPNVVQLSTMVSSRSPASVLRKSMTPCRRPSSITTRTPSRRPVSTRTTLRPRCPRW